MKVYVVVDQIPEGYSLPHAVFTEESEAHAYAAILQADMGPGFRVQVHGFDVSASEALRPTP